MHLALRLSFFANLILALVSWILLPERVASRMAGDRVWP